MSLLIAKAFTTKAPGHEGQHGFSVIALEFFVVAGICQLMSD
jgi:hypothetical protein